MSLLRQVPSLLHFGWSQYKLRALSNLSDLRNVKCNTTRAKPQLSPAAYPHPSVDLQRRKKKKEKAWSRDQINRIFISFSNKFLEAIDCNASLARQMTRALVERGFLKERQQSYGENNHLCKDYTNPQMNATARQCFSLMLYPCR